MHKLTKLAMIGAISLFTIPSWAAPFSTTIRDQIGPISGSFYVGGVTSPGTSTVGGAHLTFDLIGYGGIDGYGPRISANDVYDTFGFTVNDPTVDGVSFGAILNMGGTYPGTPTLYDNNPAVNPLNATLVSYTDNGFNQGGMARFSVDFTLLSGDNSFVFSYGLQPLAGEGWGLRNMVVSADLQPVPAPAAAWLLGSGLIGLIGVARRKIAL